MRRTLPPKGKAPAETHRCRECRHVTVVTKFHTLSIKGEPTLGECPHWTQSRCVLLSQRSCIHFKPAV